MKPTNEAADRRAAERFARHQLRASTYPLHQWRRRFAPGLWGTPRRNRSNRK